MGLPLKSVYTAVRDRALTDTVSGGLFNVTTPLIKGWYSRLAPAATTNASSIAAYPYVVCNIVDAGGEKGGFWFSLRDVILRVSIFTAGNSESTIDAIRDRIMGDWTARVTRVPVYGFDRHVLVLPNNYYTTAMLLDNQTELFEEKVTQTILEFRFALGLMGTTS